MKSAYESNMYAKLLSGSSDAIQRAIRHYLDEEYDHFLIHAGRCFELLGKARLAAIHPSLIVDKDFNSFLHVCGASHHSKRPPWNIKTITATEVLSRCTQLHPTLQVYGPRLQLLAEHRNSAIHLGEIVEDEKKAIFHTLIASTCLIADELAISRENFFADFSGLVAAHLDESLAELNRDIAERLARCKGIFERRFFALDEKQMQVAANSIEASYLTVKYESMLVDCPACGMQGLTSGTHDVDWDVDWDEGYAVGGSAVVTLTAASFNCDFCSLDLDGADELKASGLPIQWNIDDVDPADFYSDPDHP
jgi:hypothetical protein